MPRSPPPVLNPSLTFLSLATKSLSKETIRNFTGKNNSGVSGGFIAKGRWMGTHSEPCSGAGFHPSPHLAVLACRQPCLSVRRSQAPGVSASHSSWWYSGTLLGWRRTDEQFPPSPWRGLEPSGEKCQKTVKARRYFACFPLPKAEEISPAPIHFSVELEAMGCTGHPGVSLTGKVTFKSS